MMLITSLGPESLIFTECFSLMKASISGFAWVTSSFNIRTGSLSFKIKTLFLLKKFFAYHVLMALRLMCYLGRTCQWVWEHHKEFSRYLNGVPVHARRESHENLISFELFHACMYQLSKSPGLEDLSLSIQSHLSLSTLSGRNSEACVLNISNHICCIYHMESG